MKHLLVLFLVIAFSGCGDTQPFAVLVGNKEEAQNQDIVWLRYKLETADLFLEPNAQKSQRLLGET